MIKTKLHYIFKSSLFSRQFRSTSASSFRYSIPNHKNRLPIHSINSQFNLIKFQQVANFTQYINKSTTIKSIKYWDSKKIALVALGLITLEAYIFHYDALDFYFGILSRTIMTVGTGAWVIGDYMLHWDDSSSDPRKRHHIHQRNAELVLKAMEFNGGVYIKFGQHLTALSYILPKEWCDTFRPLHDACPQTELKDIDKMLKKDMGKSLNELFSTFDEEPLGTASIAQVHRAVLRDNGMEVAVKLQHPKVAQYSQWDLQTTLLIVRLAKKLLPAFEFEWLAEEMNKNLPNELDFQQEGLNAQKAKANFENVKGVALKIPEVYWALKRVVCMEFVRGCKLNDKEYMRLNKIDPELVSREITKVFSEMIYKHRFIHCDAHPGNLLVRATPLIDGKNFEVILLDHGLYQELSEEFIKNYAKLWDAIIQADIPSVQKYSLSLGGTDDTFKLISSILTGQTWDNLQRNRHDTNAFDHVDVMAYLPSVAKLLANVPRELIFLFKAQDLLKLVYQELGNVNQTLAHYCIIWSYCHDLMKTERLHLVDDIVAKKADFRLLKSLFRFREYLFIFFWDINVRCKIFLYSVVASWLL